MVDPRPDSASGDDARVEGPVVPVRPAPTLTPRGFVGHRYEHTWVINRSRDVVWGWLCDPSTFTDSQVWPWRVEFLNGADGETGFMTGVYNAHVGPFTNFSGVLGEIRDKEYRDLQYFYGSFAISPALFRPTRLQFWLDDHPDGPGASVLHLRLDAAVRRSARGVWGWLMRRFWARFGRWCERATE
jgi:hypothetical protein